MLVALEKKINECLARSVCVAWDRSFLLSILHQISKGRQLSVKQKETIGKVLARNCAEAQKKHENWQINYEKEYKTDAKGLGTYHSRQPYYRPMAADILSDVIPERSRFLRMYNNKYSKKVLSEHSKIPRYSVGDYVIPRTSFNAYKNVETFELGDYATQRKVVENFQKRGGFVIEICKEIYSAAKNTKRYKLLPIGETIPLIVEERFLKVAPSK